KPCRVSRTSGMNCGQSAESLSRIRIAVTMCVFVPHAMCAFVQAARCFVTPYLKSYQRSYLLLPKPDESIAKLVSTVRSGRALYAIRLLRIGVSASLSKKWQTFVGGIAFAK